MRVSTWKPGRPSRFAFIAAASLIFAAALPAQNSTSVVNGSVVDPSGDVIPSAEPE